MAPHGSTRGAIRLFVFHQAVFARQSEREQDERTVYPVELYGAMFEAWWHPDQAAFGEKIFLAAQPELDFSTQVVYIIPIRTDEPEYFSPIMGVFRMIRPFLVPAP